ncbi:MAG: septation regulator SpoVG [Clostridia bacterium]|nr:septation regulator SpoVG [Clostridia bacterium]
MNISDVRVRIVRKGDTKLKAVASVTFDDCFVVHDIKVIEGNEGYFIAMPSRKTADGEYKDIAHPIKTEMREELIKVILSAFEEEKAKPQED